jgi:predicted MFS family arabinose efflux permease
MSVPVSKGLLAVLGFAFAVEGALYSAVTPILPLLSRQLGMSESEAGMMLSSYSAGLVAGALLAALILRRLNSRTVAVAALMLLAVSTMLFPWALDYHAALSLRLVQGFAGGSIWTACITWIWRLYPIEQRGEALGLAVSPAVIGTIAGPAIGTVAVDVGIRGPYVAVGLLCLVASVWLARMPEPPRGGVVEIPERGARGPGRRLAVLGGVTAMVAGALLGLVNLAGPLVLARLGAAERTAGVVFLLAAVVTVFLGRRMGTLVDRWGAATTGSAALVLMAITLPLFGIAVGIVVTGLCLGVLLVSNNFCYIAASAMLTREGERAGWSLSFVTAVAATVWGTGETIGALAAGVGLHSTGTLPTALAGSVTALVMLGAVIVVTTFGCDPDVSSLQQEVAAS